MIRLLFLSVILALSTACDAVTPLAPVDTSEFEGFTVHCSIPAHPVGIVYLFHGTGGSADFGLKIETLDQTNELLKRGYGWVSTESTQRMGNKRWNVKDPSLTGNPDLARLQRLQEHLVATTGVTHTTPIFGIGMSNGARMVTLFGQVFADNGYPIAAVAPFMGTAPPVVQFSGGLRVPGFWVNAVNDFTVLPAAVAADQQASASLGVPSVLFTKAEETLLPIRFTRIPAIDEDEAQAIFDVLSASGVWNTEGSRVVDITAAVAILATLSLPPNTGATVNQIFNQVKALLAVHQFTSIYAVPLADFFDAQRLSSQH